MTLDQLIMALTAMKKSDLGGGGEMDVRVARPFNVALEPGESCPVSSVVSVRGNVVFINAGPHDGR